MIFIYFKISVTKKKSCFIEIILLKQNKTKSQKTENWKSQNII